MDRPTVLRSGPALRARQWAASRMVGKSRKAKANPILHVGGTQRVYTEGRDNNDEQRQQFNIEASLSCVCLASFACSQHASHRECLSVAPPLLELYTCPAA